MKFRPPFFARLLLLIFLLGNQWCGFVSASPSDVVAWEQGTASDAIQPDEAGQLQAPATLLWQPGVTRLAIDSPELLGRHSSLPQHTACSYDGDSRPAQASRWMQLSLSAGSLAGLTLLLQHSRLQL